MSYDVYAFVWKLDTYEFYVEVPSSIVCLATKNESIIQFEN